MTRLNDMQILRVFFRRRHDRLHELEITHPIPLHRQRCAWSKGYQAQYLVLSFPPHIPLSNERRPMSDVLHIDTTHPFFTLGDSGAVFSLLFRGTVHTS